MKDLLNTIHNCDCVPFMNSLEEESINLIIADPPYGLNFGKAHGTYNRDDDFVLGGYVEVESAEYPTFSENWIGAAGRVLKKDGSMYIVTGHTHLEYVMTAARTSGLKLRDHIIWQYPFGVYTKHRYVVSHYSILHYVKDLKKVKFYGDARESDRTASYHDRSSVWNFNRENWRGAYKTPTTLPYNLIKKMIEYSSVENDLVFDPFLGSGQTAFVAKDVGRNYLGTELCKNYFDFASRRLKSGQYLIKDWEEEKQSLLPSL